MLDQLKKQHQRDQMAAVHTARAVTDYERNFTEAYQREELKADLSEEASKNRKLGPLSELKQKNTGKMGQGKNLCGKHHKIFQLLSGVENHCYTSINLQPLWKY